jgi:voltage-gated potassium channel
MVPVTAFGRVIGGVVSVVGVASLALFTSVITISFMDQLRQRREALRRAIAETVAETEAARSTLLVCPHCGESLEQHVTIS